MAQYTKTHQPCPNCNSSDALSLYPDGHTFCFSCRATNGAAGKARFTLPDLSTIELKKRKIKRTITAKYGVGIDPQTQLLYFPYYSGSQLIGAKTKSRDKQFRWVGDRDKAELFGMQCAKGDKHVIITEGEMDALAAFQMLGYWAVSIPFGAGTAENYLRKASRWLNKFQNIYICFDNDEAGLKATEVATKVLKQGKTKIVRLPLGCKDASDCLMQGKEQEFKQAIWDAQPYSPPNLVSSRNAEDMAMDIYLHRKKRQGLSTRHWQLDELIGGWRGGEVTVLTSGTGLGKSTLARQLAFNLAADGIHTFFVPLEQTVGYSTLYFAQLHMKQECIKSGQATEAEVRHAVQTIMANITQYNHFGMVNLEDLVESIEYSCTTRDTKLVVIDHLHAAIGSGVDERKHIDDCMARFKSLALERNVHILIVAHQSRDYKDGDDTQSNLSRLRGSAGISQYADCVLGLSRKRDSQLVELKVLKASRSWGEFGNFFFRFDPATTFLIPTTDPDSDGKAAYNTSRLSKCDREHQQVQQPDRQNGRLDVQKQTRSQGMAEEQKVPDRVREPDNPVHSPQVVQAGLHSTEWEPCRDKRVAEWPDPNQAIAFVREQAADKLARGVYRTDGSTQLGTNPQQRSTSQRVLETADSSRQSNRPSAKGFERRKTL